LGKTAHKVVLLTTAEPKPTSAYLVDRLITEELIDAVIIVRRTGPLERVQRASKIIFRTGINGALRRARAARLRRRELKVYRDRYLVHRLFPNGVKPLRFPSRIEFVAADRINSKSTAAAFASLAPTIAVQAGAGLIGRRLLDIPSVGILSLHHGIMPTIRGMDSILWSFVENRPEWAGITVQLLNEGLDTGRIITQASVKAGPRQNPFSVVAQATELGAELMARSIRTIKASGKTDGWHCDGTSTYRSSLTPDAIHRLKVLCQARRDDGSETEAGSRGNTDNAERCRQATGRAAALTGDRV
jgi:folate-dependent phosphoribosylglycinamide formyltransferase PurN